MCTVAASHMIVSVLHCCILRVAPVLPSMIGSHVGHASTCKEQGPSKTMSRPRPFPRKAVGDGRAI